MDVSLTIFKILTHLARKQRVISTQPLLDAPQRWNALQYQHNLYTAKKYFSWATISSLTLCGLSSLVYPLLAPKFAKSREIPPKFDLTAVQGHPRSSILVSIESPCVTSYQSLIVTLDVSPTVFEILTFKSRKWLIFPTPPCLTRPLGGNPLEFLDETYLAKTRVTGLPRAVKIS